jgi:toxin FitB
MLLDSNIIIYLSQPEYSDLRKILQGKKLCTSVICKIETLGYHKLTQTHRVFLTSFFNSIAVIKVTDLIADESIRLRQTYNIPLADAIIAATALVEDLELITHNTADFRKIDGLLLRDPIQNQ